MEREQATLTAIDLREISMVSAWPAYEGTEVNARNKGATTFVPPRPGPALSSKR